MNMILYKIIRLVIPSRKVAGHIKFWLIFYPRLKENCDICQSIRALKKLNIKFPHPVGIVIGKNVDIGRNCTIYQNVSLVNSLNEKTYGKPTLKNNVIIYSNSVVMGKITIGENAIVGAGSIVTKSILDNEIWAGNPAKFIKKRKSQTPLPA